MRTGLIAIATAVGFMALTPSANAAGAASESVAGSQLAPSVSPLVASLSGASRARAAGVPRVSPGVRRSLVYGDSYYICDYGYVCAFVPYGSGWYRFSFTRCGQYRVANWYGRGWIINNQYGGVRFTLSDARHRTIFSSTRRRLFRGVGWNPVYFVRPC